MRTPARILVLLFFVLSMLSPVYGEMRLSLRFFHGDHLGSAHWITNYKGLPIQYLHYAPYGELMANQQVTGRPYDERFKFTGKERDSETNYDYFGARFYSSLLGHWLSVDPLSDKYPNISPYAYCGWNPIMLIDPDGKLLETAWDIANAMMDIASLKSNTSKGNLGASIVDGVGLLLDAGSVVLPGVPGGVGTAIKAYRAVDKASDVRSFISTFRQTVVRGIQSEMRVLKDMGLAKNTKKFASRTVNGKQIVVIPDAIKDGVMYEIKDTKAIYYTEQIQGEFKAAEEAGLKLKIVTGEKTYVSPNIPQNVEIIRRRDLGPQN